MVGTFYFWQISKHWQGLEIYAASLCVISLIGSTIMPESPKFLITMKRYDEARHAISAIAKANGKEPFNELFDREVADKVNPRLNQSSFMPSVLGDNRGTMD